MGLPSAPGGSERHPTYSPSPMPGRDDELEAAWKLFTPLLHELEQRQVQPELYPYGSRGPIGAHYLAAKHGVRWGDSEESENGI